MKKLAFIFSLLFAVQAYAETSEHPPEDLSDIPPTYDYDEGQFSITLPMRCTTNERQVFERLENGGYELAFLGQSMSMAGTQLFVSVFMHKTNFDYYILLTNKDSGGVCEVTSGDYGAVFDIKGMGI